MIVGIHQPQYLPWIPYFQKIKQCDTFIILDNVEFHKNGLQNRNKIKSSVGYQWLTVPVRHKRNQKILDVLINNKINWRRKHYESISLNYSKSIFFNDYQESFKKIYNRDWDKLVDLNMELIYLVMKILNINTKILKSSDMIEEGKSTKLLVNLCKQVGATTYLSGIGAKDYLDEDEFLSNNIELVFNSPLLPTKYKQIYNKIEFLNDLSVVDIIMNCGNQWNKYF
tara:strand:+ start:42 stop:719 length:678 start_codon:yes stop_codon:yes gene_type:complete